MTQPLAGQPERVPSVAVSAMHVWHWPLVALVLSIAVILGV